MAGDDTIAFATNGTITLISPLPVVTDNLTITGPGTNLITISGNNALRIFSFSPGTTNTISSVTVTDDLAPANQNGGGIFNAGSLTLKACRITANATAGGFGGGIFNQGNLSMSFTTLAHNTAKVATASSGGGGGGGFGGGVFTTSGEFRATDCTFEGNQAVGGNGGPSGIQGSGGGINGGQMGVSGAFGGGGGSAADEFGPGGDGGFGAGGGSGINGVFGGGYLGGGRGGVGGGGQASGPNGIPTPAGGGGGAGIGGSIFPPR